MKRVSSSCVFHYSSYKQSFYHQPLFILSLNTKKHRESAETCELLSADDVQSSAYCPRLSSSVLITQRLTFLSVTSDDVMSYRSYFISFPCDRAAGWTQETPP